MNRTTLTREQALHTLTHGLTEYLGRMGSKEAVVLHIEELHDLVDYLLETNMKNKGQTILSSATKVLTLEVDPENMPDKVFVNRVPFSPDKAVWKPISTAPHDRPILVCGGTHEDVPGSDFMTLTRPVIAEYYDDEDVGDSWFKPDDSYSGIVKPTHWTELPRFGEENE